MSHSRNPTLPRRPIKTLIIPLLLLAVSCAGGGDTTLRVMAASSLTEAFEDMATAFGSQNPHVSVKLDFGGSQRLRSQLEFGAKADVFASADQLQMELLFAADLLYGEHSDIAVNTLALIAVKDGPVRTIADIALPGVRLILAQGAVPAGSYSRQLLANLSEDDESELSGSFAEDVLSNLVSEEPNVRNVAQKVALGEVDAGIVYQTDVLVAQAEGDVRSVPIPAELNVGARYPIAVMEDSSEKELAQAFVAFVLSKTGQDILGDHGFSSP